MLITISLRNLKMGQSYDVQYLLTFLDCSLFFTYIMCKLRYLQTITKHAYNETRQRKMVAPNC